MPHVQAGRPAVRARTGRGRRGLRGRGAKAGRDADGRAEAGRAAVAQQVFQ